MTVSPTTALVVRNHAPVAVRSEFGAVVRNITTPQAGWVRHWHKITLGVGAIYPWKKRFAETYRAFETARVAQFEQLTHFATTWRGLCDRYDTVVRSPEFVVWPESRKASLQSVLLRLEQVDRVVAGLGSMYLSAVQLAGAAHLFDLTRFAEAQQQLAQGTFTETRATAAPCDNEWVARELADCERIVAWAETCWEFQTGALFEMLPCAQYLELVAQCEALGVSREVLGVDVTPRNGAYWINLRNSDLEMCVREAIGARTFLARSATTLAELRGTFDAVRQRLSRATALLASDAEPKPSEYRRAMTAAHERAQAAWDALLQSRSTMQAEELSLLTNYLANVVRELQVVEQLFELQFVVASKVALISAAMEGWKRTVHDPTLGNTRSEENIRTIPYPAAAAKQQIMQQLFEAGEMLLVNTFADELRDFILSNGCWWDSVRGHLKEWPKEPIVAAEQSIV